MYVSVSVDLFSNTAASRTLKKKKEKGEADSELAVTHNTAEGQ